MEEKKSIQPIQSDQHHPQDEDDQHQERKPVEPIQPDQPPGMIQVAVVLERPSSEELVQHNRAEKYQILRTNTAELRGGLIAWIEEQGLSEEVSRIGEATVFNMLFVVCTPRVAEELTRAPGVVSVSPGEDFRVDLLRA